MRFDLHEKLHELTALRKRAGDDITLRIRREADLLADVHHELVDLLSAIGPMCLAQTRQSSSSSSSSSPSRSSTTTAAASSSSANVDLGPRLALLRIDAVAARPRPKSLAGVADGEGRPVPKASATIDPCRRLARTRNQRLDRRPPRVRRTAATCSTSTEVGFIFARGTQRLTLRPYFWRSQKYYNAFAIARWTTDVVSWKTSSSRIFPS